MAGSPRRAQTNEKAKRRFFGVISTVIGIALSVAAIKGMAVLWIMVEDGRYVPAAELFERTQNTYVRDLTRGTDCRYVDTLYPHPYLGSSITPTGRAGGRASTMSACSTTTTRC